MVISKTKKYPSFFMDSWKSVFFCIIVFTCISVVFTCYSLYGDYTKHRLWVSSQISSSYHEVEVKQSKAIFLLRDLVSNRVDNRPIVSSNDIEIVRISLVELLTAIASVGSLNDDVIFASNNYKNSIAKLSRVLVSYNIEVNDPDNKLLMSINDFELTTQIFNLIDAAERFSNLINKPL